MICCNDSVVRGTLVERKYTCSFDRIVSGRNPKLVNGGKCNDMMRYANNVSPVDVKSS